MNLVLDTSVVVKWFVEEKDVENALAIRTKFVRREVELFLPDLLFYELANVLRYKPDFNNIDVHKSISSLFNIGISPLPFSEIVAIKAVTIAMDFEVTFYDAYFYALAEELSIRLLTADEKAYSKLKSTPGVGLLRDFQG
jgi:predicted nucleic acid-binding protein